MCILSNTVKFKQLIVLSLLSMAAVIVRADLIINPGFEGGWDGWQEKDKDGKSAAISDDSFEGDKSAKLTGGAGSFAQRVRVQPNTQYELSAYVKGSGIIGVKIGGQLFYERLAKVKKWQPLTVTFSTADQSQAIIFAQFNGKKSLFDNFSLSRINGAAVSSSSSVRLANTGLSPDLPPAKNFDLLGWYVSTPEPGAKGNGKVVYERELAAGYQHPDYFYTAEDGGMVFRATVAGKRTSSGTKYTRTELREMLRRGNRSIDTKGEGNTPNKNNWVFSTTSKRTQNKAGAVDGNLKATLAVNHVTTSGVPYQVGRVIIGQIHARDDEPLRLYYRKLPNNTHGSIYAAHEVPGQGDSWYEILGSRSNSADNPEQGIQLNEKFSYEIDAKGHQLTVIISQSGKELGRADIDMSASGYDNPADYMYFKAGVYNQNNSGKPDDYVQATFYLLKASH